MSFDAKTLIYREPKEEEAFETLLMKEGVILYIQVWLCLNEGVLEMIDEDDDDDEDEDEDDEEVCWKTVVVFISPGKVYVKNTSRE